MDLLSYTGKMECKSRKELGKAEKNEKAEKK
jgi:hypothetical protein